MWIKFPDQPAKFMESEVELNDEMQKLHVIATVPEHYTLLMEMNTVHMLVELLNHDHPDIFYHCCWPAPRTHWHGHSAPAMEKRRQRSWWISSSVNKWEEIACTTHSCWTNACYVTLGPSSLCKSCHSRTICSIILSRPYMRELSSLATRQHDGLCVLHTKFYMLHSKSRLEIDHLFICKQQGTEVSEKNGWVQYTQAHNAELGAS